MDNNELYNQINNQLINEIQSVDKVKDYVTYSALAEKLIKSNWGLICKCATKYKKLATKDEALQTLSIILIRCADKFDVSRNVTFASYFVRSADVSFERTLSDDKFTKFKGRQKTEFKLAYAKLKAEGNTDPTFEEVIARMASDDYDNIYNIYHPLSLDTPMNDEEGIAIMDAVASDECIPRDFEQKEQNYRLLLALKALPEQYGDFIVKVYWCGKSINDLSSEYGTSCSYIRAQIARKQKVLKTLIEHYMDELLLADSLRKQYTEANKSGKTFDTDKVLGKMNITNANLIKLITLYQYKYPTRFAQDCMISKNARVADHSICDPADAAKVVDICVLGRPMAEICTKYQIKPTSMRTEINGILKRVQVLTGEKEPITEKIADRN